MWSIMVVKEHILVPKNVQDWKREFMVRMMALVC